MRSTHIYNDDEIRRLREGGAILSRILKELVEQAAPGVSTADLDAHAESEMRKAGGTPAFKGYKAGGDIPFPGTVCISLDHEVVHGPPVPARVLQAGQLLKMDIGLKYEGLHTDMAVTVPIGDVPEKVMRLMSVTQSSLYAGIEAVRPGGLIRDIGRAVQGRVEPEGFSIVRDLVGHGVGHGIHEEPQIPNYDHPGLPKVKVQKGMVLAIEPMVNIGGWQVGVADDQWTIITSDKSLSAHYEVTLAVTEDGPEIITPQPIKVTPGGVEIVR